MKGMSFSGNFLGKGGGSGKGFGGLRENVAERKKAFPGQEPKSFKYRS